MLACMFYVCMYICMCVCMYVFVYVCDYVYMYVCSTRASTLYVRIIYIYMYGRTYVNVRMYVIMYVACI